MRNLRTSLLLAVAVLTAAAGIRAEIYGPIIDDYKPDVDAKVARASFVSGEAKLKRAESDVWEEITLNLPIVEGDEIATGAGTRLEIQFDNDRHMRLGEDSLATIMTFRDDGVAVSLLQGSMNLRIARFESEGPYFEIDAPRTTIAVRSAGSFRIDALPGSNEVIVAATDGGEARVYSETAGFILRDGRRARIFLAGQSAGEWETTAASRFVDDLDRWAAARDRTIAQSLRTAHYGQYYDDDIYGADDLTNYGQWQNLPGYGYVWQPYSTSINQYSNWSPYRYGHWRWMRPWGWVWVNDEPWGWATYHHGRWFYHRGRWYWSPYGYHRTGRSWWYPALVVMTSYGNNWCWYPLPYHYSFYNYNYYFIRTGKIRNHGGPRNPHEPQAPNNQPNNLPPWTPPVAGQLPTDRTGAGYTKDPRTDDIVPITGVVSANASTFGIKQPAAQAPQDVAKAVLSRSPSEIMPPALPTFDGQRAGSPRSVVTKAPQLSDDVFNKRTGAAPRTDVKPLDADLQKTRIQGGRTPAPAVQTPGIMPPSTGAVDRPRNPAPPTVPAPVKQPPVVSAPPTSREPVRNYPPIRTEPPPVKAPPSSRSEPPPVRMPPPTQREQPPVRMPPPVRTPPPTRSDPPATKAPPPKPREEPKPAPPPSNRSREKEDGD